ncbi:uncharacterized protein LOC120644812 isoform X2 [Panicum virgatum]|uniref:uncharacterized protein LOC120644812 isoform X2 n=1 Tax=Panicum virgatum TaxID=38727 RepID=UPI0019D6A332|nr:uncharacterized protein LOC120644812 isoform X2 [Panicum virgatum]
MSVHPAAFCHPDCRTRSGVASCAATGAGLTAAISSPRTPPPHRPLHPLLAAALPRGSRVPCPHHHPARECPSSTSSPACGCLWPRRHRPHRRHRPQPSPASANHRRCAALLGKLRSAPSLQSVLLHELNKFRDNLQGGHSSSS